VAPHVGIGIAVRPTARPALRAALALSVFYGVVGTVLVPQLWTDPLAPLLKIVPLVALNLVALAILDDR
jgi:DoxX-like family